MQFPDDRQYHADHLWAQQRPEGVWRIGITDYAQEQLGGVIFVDLRRKQDPHSPRGLPAPPLNRSK